MGKKSEKEHPRVFISYSHKDKEWVRNWLLRKMEGAGIKTHIDYRDFEIGVASLINMERAVEQCAKTVLVFTPDWVESEWSQFEGVMLQTKDPTGVKKRIVPVMLEDCELPTRLGILTYADFRSKGQWDFQVARVIKQIQKDFAKVGVPKTVYRALDEAFVNIERLPKTGYELFGRQKELGLLDDAWESESTNVLAFVAYGGTGKSTLIKKWLERMRWENYRGAGRVFGWSFYSQGTRELVTSADMFIDEALKWFGDPNPSEGSEWVKGKRLAGLVRERRTLLILDGMEPLQSGLDFDKGKIKDNALAVLVRELAKENNGLCIITTREDIPELKRHGEAASIVGLDQISNEAGRELLKMRGIIGDEKALEDATEGFGNHALAINLLAEYLHLMAGHDVERAYEIPDIDVTVESGKHPRRVIEAFVKYFGEGPEVELLRILGLFDRPAERAAVDAILEGEPIEGISEQLGKSGADEFAKVLENLRKVRLIARESEHRPDVIDCHPLVREHFGEKLRGDRPGAWGEAHGRLYEYYKGVPKDEQPDTLEEMEPLFRAVYHGCAAGRHQETLDEVYVERICRGNEAFVNKQLGAFGSDLGAVACFFERLWGRPAGGLSEDRKALVLNFAGFALHAVGRLREAVEPMKACVEYDVEHERWRYAAMAGNNLSELYLTLGEVGEGVEYGRRCVEYADKSGEWDWRVAGRTALADALHQVGQVEEARGLFEEAERMQKEEQPEFRYLYSLRGYQYCDLLLGEGKTGELKERARQTLEWVSRKGGLLDMALDNLSIGRAVLAEGASKIKGQKSKVKSAEKSVDEAKRWLDEAVDGLREAGTQHHIPRGLLARVGYYRVVGDYEAALGDLEEAREIAERGGMKLHLADYHLESARLARRASVERTAGSVERSAGSVEEAGESWEERGKGHCEEALRLIKGCGYHRRDGEVRDLISD